MLPPWDLLPGISLPGMSRMEDGDAEFELLRHELLHGSGYFVAKNVLCPEVAGRARALCLR